MAKTQDIKRRIRSIGNTKKVTKAMEMVSAAKMRRAVEAVLKTRAYADLSWGTVLNLAESFKAKGNFHHPMLAPKDKPVNRIAVFLITSNRGLCGSFNSAVTALAHRFADKWKSQNQDATVDFILLGKKGSAIYRHFHHVVTSDFVKADLADGIKEIVAPAQEITQDFLIGKYDKVYVAYTDFVSIARQVPKIKQLLPMDLEPADDHLGIINNDPRLGESKSDLDKKQQESLPHGDVTQEYIFEPSPEAVLDEMLPKLIQVQLYQALLESNASEHSARMSAMNQATEAAGDMAAELTLFYNKARQASITAEIAEISAGVSAMK